MTFWVIILFLLGVFILVSSVLGLPVLTGGVAAAIVMLIALGMLYRMYVERRKKSKEKR